MGGKGIRVTGSGNDSVEGKIWRLIKRIDELEAEREIGS